MRDPPLRGDPSNLLGPQHDTSGQRIRRRPWSCTLALVQSRLRAQERRLTSPYIHDGRYVTLREVRTLLRSGMERIHVPRQLLRPLKLTELRLTTLPPSSRPERSPTRRRTRPSIAVAAALPWGERPDRRPDAVESALHSASPHPLCRPRTNPRQFFAELPLKSSRWRLFRQCGQREPDLTSPTSRGLGGRASTRDRLSLHYPSTQRGGVRSIFSR